MAHEEAREKAAHQIRWLDRYTIEAEDRFKSPAIASFFIVPEGYEGVRLRMGKASGWPFYIFPPFTHRIKPGFRFALGLGGLWSRVALVDTKLITEDLPMQNAVTEDGLELPKVDSVLNYRIVDPLRAVTAGTEYKKTTRLTAAARIRGVMQTHTLEKLAEIRKSEVNFAMQEDGHPYIFPALEQIGVKMEGLYITEIDLPDELRKLLAQRTTARAEAEGELELAKKRLEIAQLHAEAAKQYKDNPEAQMLIARDAMDELVKNNKVTIITGASGVFGSVKEMLGIQSQK